MVYTAPFVKRPTTTPLMDIEDFNGTLRPAFFFTIDLSGEFGSDRKLTKILDGVKTGGAEFSLKEFVTLADLNNTGNISDFTMNFRRQRTSLMGGENTVAKLVDLFVNEADRSVTFAFLTEVTPYPDDPDHEYQEVDPDTFELSNNRSKVYEIQIKILEFFDWLDTNPGLDKITEKDMKEIFDVANVQVFSTSPSFHWQGFNAWCSQIDASIYPTDIMPKFWDQYHGDGEAFLDKHLYGVIRQIKFWMNPMASMLTRKLKDRGLI